VLCAQLLLLSSIRSLSSLLRIGYEDVIGSQSLVELEVTLPAACFSLIFAATFSFSRCISLPDILLLDFCELTMYVSSRHNKKFPHQGLQYIDIPEQLSSSDLLCDPCRADCLEPFLACAECPQSAVVVVDIGRLGWVER
jgi:hypothetical protein